jgi:DNA-binding NtrC family response regulator
VRPGVRGWSVLIVENDAALRALYRSALVAAGYTVVAVEDGMDALRTWRVIRFRTLWCWISRSRGSAGLTSHAR